VLGVYHGLRRKHLQSYLDEFVFRFNRRYSPKTAFRSLLSIAAKIGPITYNMLTKPDTQGFGSFIVVKWNPNQLNYPLFLPELIYLPRGRDDSTQASQRSRPRFSFCRHLLTCVLPLQ
jgi:hypothetical protein